MSNNQKLTCLIIEDEPLAAEVLEAYVQQVAFLDLRGVCKDAIYAMERMKKEQIDVIFLDIHLPKLKGLEFLKSLAQKPQTILTTAYHQYALDAFEEDVVDYLLKPIEFPRFLKAVNKLKRKRVTKPTKPLSKHQANSRPYHFFNVNRKMIKVFVDEIHYVESLKDYSKIYTADDELVTRVQIGDIESLFQDHNFLRIHRSYVVSIRKIKAYSATEIELTQRTLTIGRSYKESVAQQLSHYYIDKEEEH